MSFDKKKIATAIADLDKRIDGMQAQSELILDKYYKYYDLKIKLMALDRLNVIASKLEDMLG